MLTTEIPARIDLFAEALRRLGAHPRLVHDHPERNIVLTSTRNDVGARFIHTLNLDWFNKTVHLIATTMASRCV